MAPAATHALTALAHAPVAAREYIVPGYPMDSAQLLPPGGYVPASGAPPDSASRHESASVRSNDQMSGTVTDASGYSQAYWAQGAPHFQPPRTYEVGVPAAAAVPGSTYPHQSPTTAHAQPPMRAAPDSPIAASASPVPAPMPEMREQRRYSPAVSAAAAGPSHALAAAGSGVPPVPTGSSAFAIHSLLNPPIEPPALAPHYPGGGGDVPGSPSSSTAAVLQHLAKENARFRRQSEASAHRQSLAPPAPPPGQAPRNDSSPTSQSSYHSAGYSTWYGRAETVMDYATAKQSFSSMDDASETTTHPSSAYLADAPMPALPPPYAAVASTSATTAAEAMAAFEATVASPTNALRPAGVAPPAAAGQTPLRADQRRSTKPISVLVQVGDGSEESLVHTSSDDGASYGLRAVPHAADLQSVPESGDSQRLLSGGEPGRRATMESLDNVLEYYRTSPTTADAQGHGSAAAASTADGDSAADGDR
ncbi:hypothetical protein IWQ57_005268, partial [Coemansia nantahalensis]